MPSQKHDACSNWFRASWKGGREEGCRLCVIVLHTMTFEIHDGLAMQIQHWVQKVRIHQQLSKVFLFHSISIIGTSEQQ